MLFDSDKKGIAHDMRPLAQILEQMDEIFRGNQPRQKLGQKHGFGNIFVFFPLWFGFGLVQMTNLRWH